MLVGHFNEVVRRINEMVRRINEDLQIGKDWAVSTTKKWLY